MGESQSLVGEWGWAGKECVISLGCATGLAATGPALRHRQHGPCGLRHRTGQGRSARPAAARTSAP
jgi:hypothetical protein